MVMPPIAIVPASMVIAEHNVIRTAKTFASPIIDDGDVPGPINLCALEAICPKIALAIDREIRAVVAKLFVRPHVSFAIHRDVGAAANLVVRTEVPFTSYRDILACSHSVSR